MTQPTQNRHKDLNVCGSNSSPHPAYFPRGSAESRAAARAMLSHRPITIVDSGTLPIPYEYLPSYEELLRDWKEEGDRYTHEQLNASRKRLRIVWSIPPRGADSSRVHFGEWQKWEDNLLAQQVYLPHVWLKPGEAVPTCPDCGTPFKKTCEYPSMVGFQANCMEKHDPELAKRR